MVAPAIIQENRDMLLTPASELEQRYKRLQKYLAEENLDAAIIVQNADLFYFTGTVQSANLYIPLEGEPVYMVRKDLKRAQAESGLERVVSFSSMRDIPEILTRFGYPQPQRIALEMDILPVSFFERYRKVYPDAEFTDATPLIRKVRMIKSEYEVKLIRMAAAQIDLVCRRAYEVIREGITELELTAELEYVARRAGHLGLIRMRGLNGEMLFGHAFSGADSAAPAYTDTPLGGRGMTPAFGQGAGYKKIAAHEPIIVDFAGSIDGYLADQTRVFAIGSVSDKMRRAYEDMLLIQRKMIEITTPGAVWGEIYDQCHGLAVKLGYSDYFMGSLGAQVSFIGHGLGIEIDEYPFIARGFNNMTMQAGMVFAFEPKVVYPDEGAIGIENTFYLSESGLEQLTCSSEELIIIPG